MVIPWWFKHPDGYYYTKWRALTFNIDWFQSIEIISDTVIDRKRDTTANTRTLFPSATLMAPVIVAIVDMIFGPASK